MGWVNRGDPGTKVGFTSVFGHVGKAWGNEGLLQDWGRTSTSRWLKRRLRKNKARDEAESQGPGHPAADRAVEQVRLGRPTARLSEGEMT